MQSQSEWDKLITQFPLGTNVSGVVASPHVFAVFVEIDQLPGILALLEMPHFKIMDSAPDRRLEFPTDYPRSGERIDCRILAWSLAPKDVRLTQLSDLNWCHRKAKSQLS